MMVLRISDDDEAYAIMARQRVRAISGAEMPTVEDYNKALIQCIVDKASDWKAASNEIGRLKNTIASLRREVREQRLEIAALRDERAAWLAAERPAVPVNVTDDPPQAAVSHCDSVSDAGKSVESEIPVAWLQRPYWVDPPQGWRYGFPKLYDPAAYGDMTAWMIANGYPETLARQGLPCTFTAASDEELSKNDKPT